MYHVSKVKVKPFRIKALVSDTLPVDIVVGNDLLRQTGLQLVNEDGRILQPVTMLHDPLQSFAGFASVQQFDSNHS